jgi:hypothetical protein
MDRCHLGNQDIDGNVILRHLKKMDCRSSSGSEKGTFSVLLWSRLTLKFHEEQEISQKSRWSR